MGKNLIQQRRGKGTPVYRSPSHRFPGEVKYVVAEAAKKAGTGTVKDISDVPGRTSPVAIVSFTIGDKMMLVPDGVSVGDIVEYGKTLSRGNVLELRDIPEGTKIFNIECIPGDGGKLCRSSGAFALVVSQSAKKCIIRLPSKKLKVLPAGCRATVGSIAGAGRIEKPFVRAGDAFYKYRALGRLYPRVKGVAMNAVDHPFGGSTATGKPKSVSRDAPPGRKVGSISPRRMGRKKAVKQGVVNE